MSLQQRTIQRYRQLFPQDTLRETSSRTNIQITRVFRLLNGKTMKVGELEAFEDVINQHLKNKLGTNKLHTILDEAMFLLSSEELNQVVQYIERKNQLKRFIQTQFHETSFNTQIA